MNFSYKKNTHQQGFTLIEVMAALAIVAFGISAAIAVVNSLGLNTQRIEDRAIAQWIVSNKLVELRLQQYDVGSSGVNASSTSNYTMGLREWFVFQTSQKSSGKSFEVAIEVCVDNAKSDCVLKQDMSFVPFNVSIK